jgi:hypothetical protein
MSHLTKGGGGRGGKGDEAVTAAEATLDRLKKEGQLNEDS